MAGESNDVQVQSICSPGASVQQQVKGNIAVDISASGHLRHANVIMDRSGPSAACWSYLPSVVLSCWNATCW